MLSRHAEVLMKVAAVQMDVKILEKDHNLARVLAYLQAAGSGGAKLVVFPECALTGYCYASLQEALPVAEPVPGPSTEKLAAAARALGCAAIVGMLERSGACVYNAAVVTGADGSLDTYRKIHLPGLGIDRFVTPGDKPFPVFDAGGIKVGVGICYDLGFPESGRVLKLKGAQAFVVPTNWPIGSESVMYTPQVRATENHLHVIAADRVGEERGFRFSGHSKIVNFAGEILAEAGESEETILYGELDPAAADRNRVVRVPGQWEFDRIADRRPEMYGPITQSRRA
jgi:predicted amidohydrolase